ncbi:Protein of uncharacterised function (DUF1176) [Klebsiella michiganensis]|nr:Protein of uncharacterised function (DUF1176) [Klebsiella michiganensis]
MLHRVILFLLFGLVPTSLVRAAPAQQLFNDWQVTCNNQNFCVARNVGLHHGLVMTLTRSAGAATSASLRIELGGVGNPVAALAPIAPRLRLDGKPCLWAINIGRSPTNCLKPTIASPLMPFCSRCRQQRR